MRIKLTDVAIRQIPLSQDGQVKVRDETLPGFGLIVGKKAKSFFVMYGKDRRTETLGRYPDVALAEARKAAKRLLLDAPERKISDRLSPARTTYLKECERKNRPNTVRSYRHYLSLVQDKPLSSIKPTDIDLTHPHTVTAWKVFMNWCVRRELIDKNPFLHAPVKYGKRDRVIADDEIRTLFAYDHPPFSHILKLCLLTGQRRSQISRIQPEWIKDETIAFPSEVMKSGRPHTIPIAPMTRELLKNAPFQFNGWSKAKARCDKHTGVMDWTLHDLRRTFATIHARIGTPIHVVEALLDHSSGSISGVAAIYIRHNFLPEMRRSMQEFESTIRTLIDE